MPAATDHDHLAAMLTRLKLTAVRDQLDSLLDEAARRELTIREGLMLLCEREIARKDGRRVEMAIGLARFPFVRDLATGRFIANGETVMLLRLPGAGKTHLAVAIGREAIDAGYRCCSSRHRRSWPSSPRCTPRGGWTSWATCRSSRTRRTCSSSWSRDATSAAACW